MTHHPGSSPSRATRRRAVAVGTNGIEIESTSFGRHTPPMASPSRSENDRPALDAVAVASSSKKSRAPCVLARARRLARARLNASLARAMRTNARTDE